MEKKIIKLTKYNGDDYGDCGCLTCGADKATIKVTIQRIHREDDVLTFYVCDQCVVRMQSDVHKICE